MEMEVDEEYLDDTTSDEDFLKQICTQFPVSTLKKDGSRPVLHKNIPAFLCRTFSILKEGGTKHRAVRQSCVTLGLDKFLRRSSIKNLLTQGEMADQIRAASNYISRLRVPASLLANWICIRRLAAGEKLPDASNETFFTACLQILTGAKPSTRATVNVEEEFDQFRAATGIDVIPDKPCTLTQVIVYQAKEMATAAGNFMELNYLKRVQCIIKWAFKKQLQDKQLGMTSIVLKRRIHRLVEWCTALPADVTSDNFIGKVHDRLFQLELDQFADRLEVICADASAAAIQVNATYSEKLEVLLQLQQHYLHTDRRAYLTVQNMAWQLFTDKTEEHATARSLYVQEHWSFDVPPQEMAPLPKCKDGASFIRLDQKGIGQMFPELVQYCKGPWWYECFSDPFSKAANIPVLHSTKNRYARSKKGILQALQRALQEGEACEMKCFTLVNNSIVTDGVSCKVQLVTSAHGHEPHPGVQALTKAGYQVSFKQHDLKSILKHGSGVFKLKHVRGTTEDIKDVEIIPVDPGQIHALDAVSALGHEWTRENASVLMSKTPIIYTGDQYKEDSGMAHQERHEASRRRDTAYGEALDLLALERRKTCDLNEFTSYCQVWQSVQLTLQCELLAVERRVKKFSRFRLVQSAIAKIAALIAHPRNKGSNRIAMYGGGCAGKKMKGGVSTPNKKIVRVLGCSCVVIIIPEHYTSMMCPGCCSETRAGEGYRTKMCITNLGATPCPLHPTTPSIEFDRDQAGRTNIGIRAVRSICGLPVQQRPIDIRE